MIRIRKHKPAPLALQKASDAMKEQLSKILKGGKSVVLSTKGSAGARKALSTEYVRITIDDDQYKPPEAKARLKLDQFGKCAFCEARFMDTAGGDVEHFRPKKRYDEYVPPLITSTEQIDTNLGYFQYVYDWDNHLWSCKECNQTYKKNYFDLLPADIDEPPPDSDDFDDERSFLEAVADWGKHKLPARDEWNAKGTEESPVLIDPTKEDPREHINFNTVTGMAYPAPLDDRNQQEHKSSARGGKCINVLGLNRAELVFSRLRHLTMLRGVFLQMAQDADVAVKFLLWQRGDNWATTLKSSTLRSKVAAISQGDWEPESLTPLEFLRYSTTRQAPFSALAMDALACWSLELAEHMAKAQSASIALQRSNASVSESGRNVHDLAALDMIALMRQTYSRDRTCIEKLKNEIEKYGPLWNAGYEQSTIEYVIRSKLMEVIKRHEKFKDEAKAASAFDSKYVKSWRKHNSEINDVLNALEFYNCAEGTWSGAQRALEENMENYGPDLYEDLILPVNKEVKKLTSMAGAASRELRAASRSAKVADENQARRQEAVSPIIKTLTDICVLLDSRIKACEDDPLKDAAGSYREYLTGVIGYAEKLQEGTVLADGVSQMAQSANRSKIHDWRAPKATGLRNRPEVDVEQTWNHILSQSRPK